MPEDSKNNREIDYGNHHYYDRDDDDDESCDRTLSLAAIMMSGTVLSLFLLGRIGLLDPQPFLLQQPQQQQQQQQDTGFVVVQVQQPTTEEEKKEKGGVFPSMITQPKQKTSKAMSKSSILSSSMTLRESTDNNNNNNAGNNNNAAFHHTECSHENMPSFDKKNIHMMNDENGDTTMSSTIKNTIPCSMIIIHEKLLWCPNAKVGTTSTYSILQNAGLFGERRRCYKDCNESASKWLSSQNTTKRDLVTKAQSFTIVRNPWDRLRSTYISKIQSGHLDPHTNKEYKKKNNDNNTTMSFVEFVDFVEENPTSNIHWTSYSTRCLTSSSNNDQLFWYDHVIKLEDGLFDGLERVFHAANLPFPKQDTIEIENQHTNHTNDALIEFYRNAVAIADNGIKMKDLIAKVGKIYQEDIEAFDYTFPEYDNNKIRL